MQIDLILNAIETANAKKLDILSKIEYATRLYKKNLEKQVNLQDTIISALEMQIPKKPNNIRSHVDHKSGECSICGTRLAHFGDMNYCHNCGNKIDWEETNDAEQ